MIANVYMNRDLKGFRLRGLDRRSGARLVTDAEDFGVLCRYGATEVLAQSRRWFAQIGLTLHEQKTRVCDGRREAFPCLGYTFGPMRSRKTGHAYRGAAPAKKAGTRVKGRIRPILRPGHPAPWDEGKAELNRVWRGWATYFSYGPRFMAYRAVDNDVWERARYFLGRRHQVPSRGTERYSGDVVFGELGVFRRRRSRLRHLRMLGVTPVREPDAGQPHVRFDEEGRETRDGPLGEWTPDPKGRKRWGAAGPVHERARPSLYPVGDLNPCRARAGASSIPRPPVRRSVQRL